MLRAAWPSSLPKLVRPWGTGRERKGWQVGEGSRLLSVRPCLLRAADLLWKNGRMNTCNLRSFFPGSQPDYHQPICPAELSGDMNSLLNNFLVQKQTQKGCVWGGVVLVSQPVYNLITKDKPRASKGQPLTGPWGLSSFFLPRHPSSGLGQRQERAWCSWGLGIKRQMALEIVQGHGVL